MKHRGEFFCGVEFHGELTDEAFEIVDALPLGIVGSGGGEDAVSLFEDEELLLPPVDDGVRELMLAAQLSKRRWNPR